MAKDVQHGARQRRRQGWFNLGIVLFGQQQFTEADDCFRLTCEIDAPRDRRVIRAARRSCRGAPMDACAGLALAWPGQCSSGSA